LTFQLDCPHCGGQLAVANEGATNGFEAKIVLHCAAKPDVSYLVTARIDAMSAIGWSRNRGA